MAKGIDLSIAADTRSAMSAIQRGIIDPLEDVNELLEKTGKEGKEAGNDLERGMREAQRRTDDAKDEIRDLRDELTKAGRAGKRSGDDIKDGMRRAEAGAEEFKDEANSTAREAAASFDGSAESIGDAFQEVAANAFAGFGPAGAAAGLAAAAGLGLVFAEFQKQQEAADELKQRLSGLYQEAIESGRDYITQAQHLSDANDLMWNPDRADEWKQLQQDAKDLGLETQEVIRANNGDLDAQRNVQAQINRLVEENTKTVHVGQAEVEKLDSGVRMLRDRWQSTIDTTSEYQENVKVAQAVNQQFFMEMLSDAGVAEEEVDKLGNKLLTLEDGTQVLIEADTGQATTNVDKFQGDLDGIPRTVKTKAIVEASVRSAQNEINRFVSRNNGRSIRLHGRFDISPIGGDI